jgi:hypothetical protein
MFKGIFGMIKKLLYKIKITIVIMESILNKILKINTLNQTWLNCHHISILQVIECKHKNSSLSKKMQHRWLAFQLKYPMKITSIKWIMDRINHQTSNISKLSNHYIALLILQCVRLNLASLMDHMLTLLIIRGTCKLMLMIIISLKSINQVQTKKIQVVAFAK